jgi:tRNA U34 5-methylaminomethyl-2-thiouridine-forming methyltransferase MnmC
MNSERYKIVSSDDGSHTLYDTEIDEHYHSIFGAVQESMHVFVQQGFDCIKCKKITDILEIGFGTGLNALLTYFRAIESERNVCYTAIDPFPLNEHIWKGMNYPLMINNSKASYIFENIHKSRWDETVHLSESFSLLKVQSKLEKLSLEKESFDLIYFDAFSPDSNPGLWTKKIFGRLYCSLRDGGILVTYSSKGSVKRALRDSGFIVRRLKGAGGKRHMVRGVKILKH